MLLRMWFTPLTMLFESFTWASNKAVMHLVCRPTVCAGEHKPKCSTINVRGGRDKLGRKCRAHGLNYSRTQPSEVTFDVGYQCQAPWPCESLPPRAVTTQQDLISWF